jgi:hypothetical protein
MNIKKLLILFTFFCFWGCSSNTLDNFDKQVWLNDAKGCKNERLKYLESIEKQKDALRGLSQAQIVAVLGKPDSQELLKRNAKTFTYFVSQGSQCGSGTKEGTALIVHFGALNYVSELSRNQY